MFYDATRGNHGLPHDPFKAIVAPRPVGWISALDAAGRVNLSPYSFFNAISSTPPLVMFSSEGRKDAVSFIAETGEFTCNLASFGLRDAMNATSAPLPRGESEFIHAGLATAPGQMVKCPRVAASPAALECKLVSIQELSDMKGVAIDRWMVIGQVVGVYIDDACLTDGRFDIVKAAPIARCGYQDYAAVHEVFSLKRPG